MSKPAGFPLTVTVLWIFIVAGVVVAFLPMGPVPMAMAPKAMEFAAALKGPAAIFSALIASIFVFFYSKGHNWARWVIMVASVLYILGGLIGIATIALAPAKSILGLLEAAFGVYLIYFLNTTPVKAWFEMPKPTV